MGGANEISCLLLRLPWASVTADLAHSQFSSLILPSFRGEIISETMMSYACSMENVPVGWCPQKTTVYPLRGQPGLPRMPAQKANVFWIEQKHFPKIQTQTQSWKTRSLPGFKTYQTNAPVGNLHGHWQSVMRHPHGQALAHQSGDPPIYCSQKLPIISALFGYLRNGLRTVSAIEWFASIANIKMLCLAINHNDWCLSLHVLKQSLNKNSPFFQTE